MLNTKAPLNELLGADCEDATYRECGVIFGTYIQRAHNFAVHRPNISDQVFMRIVTDKISAIEIVKAAENSESILKYEVRHERINRVDEWFCFLILTYDKNNPHFSELMTKYYQLRQ